MPRKSSRGKDDPNPFASIGPPVRGLVPARELDRVLDDEALDHLADLAGLPPAHRRRHWFRRGVLATVRGWLAEAADPCPREVAAELEPLVRELEACLPNPEPEGCRRVADLRRALGPSALDTISRYGAVEVPSPDELARGDNDALHRLYGLVPGRIERRAGRRTFSFDGPGRSELKVMNRPPDTRTERLALLLAVLYHGATGLAPTRGLRAPFQGFVTELLRYLRAGTEADHGDKAIRRAVARFKSLYGKG